MYYAEYSETDVILGVKAIKGFSTNTAQEAFLAGNPLWRPIPIMDARHKFHARLAAARRLEEVGIV